MLPFIKSFLIGRINHLLTWEVMLRDDFVCVCARARVLIEFLAFQTVPLDGKYRVHIDVFHQSLVVLNDIFGINFLGTS